MPIKYTPIATAVEKLRQHIQHQISKHGHYGGDTSVDEAINGMSNVELLDMLASMDTEQ